MKKLYIKLKFKKIKLSRNSKALKDKLIKYFMILKMINLLQLKIMELFI